MRSENRPGGQESSGTQAGHGRSFIEEARRRQIIDCTIDTIADLGFVGASLAQIAKRAGISKGVISYHFAGKAELLEQVVVHIYTRGAEYVWEHGLEDAVGQGSTAEALRAYIAPNIRFIAEHPRWMRVLTEIFLNLRREDGSTVYGADSEEPMLAPLEDMLRSGQAAGEFRSFDTRVMALAIRRVIDGTPPLLDAFPDTDVGAYADEVVDLFLAATRATRD